MGSEKEFISDSLHFRYKYDILIHSMMKGQKKNDIGYKNSETYFPSRRQCIAFNDVFSAWLLFFEEKHNGYHNGNHHVADRFENPDLSFADDLVFLFSEKRKNGVAFGCREGTLE
jgi:hypothetical protein